MLAAGTPDGRPDRLPGELARLLDDDRIWALITPEERARPTPRASGSGRLGARLAEAIDRLGRRGRRLIQHDDLHGGNIVVGPAGDRFFDWGDAVVGPPVRDADRDLQLDRPQDRAGPRRPRLRPAARRKKKKKKKKKKKSTPT